MWVELRDLNPCPPANRLKVRQAGRSTPDDLAPTRVVDGFWSFDPLTNRQRDWSPVVSDDLEFFTYSEAAERLRVSESTLRKWVARRVIRHHKVGGRLVRFTNDDLLSAFKVVEPLLMFPGFGGAGLAGLLCSALLEETRAEKLSTRVSP